MEKERSNTNSEIDVSIVIVSYNVRSYLADCLKSIHQNTAGIFYEILVIDNASSDGSADMVACEFPEVKLIRNQENLGFPKSNNIAIVQSKGKYVLLLNPDTILLNDALRNMIGFLDSHPEAGVVGPQVLDPNGRVQCSAKNYFPALVNSLLISYFLRRLFKTHEYAHSHVTEETCWVIGSCMMAKRMVLDEVGLLNEGLTFFFEDADLCYRIVRAGWKVYFLEEAKIVHYGGGSWKQLDCSFLLGKQGLYQFFEANYGRPCATGFKLAVLLEKLLIGFLGMLTPGRFRVRRLGEDYEGSLRDFLDLGSLKLPHSTRGIGVQEGTKTLVSSRARTAQEGD